MGEDQNFVQLFIIQLQQLDECRKEGQYKVCPTLNYSFTRVEDSLLKSKKQINEQCNHDSVYEPERQVHSKLY